MNNTDDKKNRLRIEYKLLAKNSFYNFLNNYGVILLSMITSFFTARIISPTVWGYLIVSLSYINIFLLILNFFPPSLGPTFNYYIPRYRALNQNTKLKSLIKHALIFRLFFVLLTFLLGIIIYLFFTELLSFTLKSYSYLFYILSPLIIINGLDIIFLDIFRPLNMFKTAFIMLLIRYSIHIGGLVFLFLYNGVIEVSYIAFVILFANLIPFLIDCVILFLILQLKIKKTADEPMSFKESFKDLYKYGFHLSFQTFIDNLFKEFRIQSVGFFESPEMVTGYNISVHYRNISLESVLSLNKPLVISFSSLYIQEKRNQVMKVFRITFHYFTFLILIVTGIIYFLIDFLLLIIYGHEFLKFSILLKLMIITIIFSVQNTLFFSLLRSSDKIKYIIPVSLMSALIKMPAFLLGLIFYGVLGAIIALFIANVVYFILIAILNYKIFGIKIGVLRSFLQYIIFFIALGISLVLETLFLKQINYVVLKALNLLIFQNIEFLSLFAFLLIFLLLNYFLKIFSRSDIEILEKFFDKETPFHKFIRKMLRFVKKIIRD